MLSYLAPPTVWDRPSTLYSLLSNPIAFFARTLHDSLAYLRAAPIPFKQPIRIVCISDTHTLIKEIPDGDLLIHAGDLTNAGTTKDIQAQLDWLDSLPHAQKICIAGNHDTYLDPKSRKTLKAGDQKGSLDWRSIHYLQHASVTLKFPIHRNRLLKIYGAPQIPYNNDPRCAFRYERSQDAWSETVPLDVDILVTHTPPRWHLDLPIGLGCEWLLRELWRVKPRLHVFGHVHAGHGTETIWFDRAQSAYERVCQRTRNPITSLINPVNWIDLIKIFAYGVKGVLWNRIWVGSETASTLVNAALISQSSGKLDNPVVVVEV